MGCSFSRANGCYSPTCCCCLEVDEACSWIAIVGLVWGGVATLVDFISANLPRERCVGCLDHDLNVQLSVAAGCINLVQWVASVLLLIGAKLDNRWLLLPWLAWGVVSLVMQGVWLALTLPGTPSVRTAASLFQLVWGVHFFIVVKTQYTKLALTFIEADRPPPDVPPNTPVRKHKRRWRRLHPACQPPIRTLLGVGLRLQRALDHAKKVKEMLSEDESEQEEEEEREHEEEIRVTVESHGSFAARGEEETCSRRRSGWRASGERTEDGRGEQDVWEVIVHTSNRDVRGRVELKRRAEDEEDEDKPEMQQCDDEDEEEVDEKEKKKTENESEEEEEEEEASEKKEEEEEASEKKEKDEKLTKKKTEEKEESPKEDDMEDSNKNKTNENQEGDGSEAECPVVIEGAGESGPILYRASKPPTPH